jgi:hypothetical protein
MQNNDVTTILRPTAIDNKIITLLSADTLTLHLNFNNSRMPLTRGQKREEEMDTALKTFFSSPRFAVAGASSDPNKYGHTSASRRYHTGISDLTED